jgi:hypothetical protein
MRRPTMSFLASFARLSERSPVHKDAHKARLIFPVGVTTFSYFLLYMTC